MSIEGILNGGNTQQEILRLRERLMDLERNGLLQPEAAQMYKMTVLQIWQECERRRDDCLRQAQSLREQAKAAEAQSHAFSIMGSVLYSVVNGYMILEEKRVHEEAERRKEREEVEASAEKPAKKRRKNGEHVSEPPPAAPVENVAETEAAGASNQG